MNRIFVKTLDRHELSLSSAGRASRLFKIFSQDTSHHAGNDQQETHHNDVSVPLLPDLAGQSSDGQGLNQTDICVDCRELDLETILSGPTRGVDVGRRFRTPSKNGCPLCDMLYRTCVCIIEHGREIDDGDILFAIPLVLDDRLFRFEERNISGRNPKYLAVLPKSRRNAWDQYKPNFGYPLVLDPKNMPDTFTPQAVPRRFSPDAACHWIKYCDQYHSALCSVPRANGSQIKLRLIDCYTSEIVLAPGDNTRYVALSYVWGAPINPDNLAQDEVQTEQSPKLPSTVPLLITDAMLVTKQLGYQYLWVDKFCMNQSDERARQEEINRMDSIYECAELTIIAAAGVDATYGLPGVSSRPRSIQPIAITNHYKIIWSMRNPRGSIRRSRWSTRGWTFQENLLSRRRLVFTDDQMYFECNAMNCYESITFPLDKVHEKDRSKMRASIRSGILGGQFSKYTDRQYETLPRQVNDNDRFLQYLGTVEEYSRRTLTFDKDSLNAFQGVMRRFARDFLELTSTRFHLVCGLGFLADLHQAPANQMDSSFVYALTWKHKQYCWDPDGTPRRRLDFPSWSWAGWAGEVSYPHGWSQGVRSDLEDICLCHEGNWLTLHELSSKAAAPGTTHKITALRFMAKRVLPHHYSWNATYPESAGGPATALSHGLESKEEAWRQLAKGDSLISVRLGRGTGGWPQYLMALRKNTDEETYTRVGLLELHTNSEMMFEDAKLERFTVI